MASAARPIQTSPATAVQTTTEPKGLIGLLTHETARQRIAPFLHGVKLERVVQEVILAANENPEIRKCTPQSIVSAVARACSWGGVIGEDIHLVPFGNTLKAMLDYKFKAKLIVATGTARQVYAFTVYANERFELTLGTSMSVVHARMLDAKARGPMVGVYAVAKLKMGDVQVVSLSLPEVEKIRAKSKQWSTGPCPEWYACKTAIHQLAKLLPASEKMAKLVSELDHAQIEEDDTDDIGAPEPLAALPSPELSDREAAEERAAAQSARRDAYLDAHPRVAAQDPADPYGLGNGGTIGKPLDPEDAAALDADAKRFDND